MFEGTYTVGKRILVQYKIAYAMHDEGKATRWERTANIITSLAVTYFSLFLNFSGLSISVGIYPQICTTSFGLNSYFLLHFYRFHLCSPSHYFVKPLYVLMVICSCLSFYCLLHTPEDHI